MLLLVSKPNYHFILKPCHFRCLPFFGNVLPRANIGFQNGKVRKKLSLLLLELFVFVLEFSVFLIVFRVSVFLIVLFVIVLFHSPSLRVHLGKWVCWEW